MGQEKSSNINNRDDRGYKKQLAPEFSLLTIPDFSFCHATQSRRDLFPHPWEML